MAEIIFDQTRFGDDGAFLNDSDPVGVANLQTTNLVAQENSQRKARYLTAYASYVTNMSSGQPIPPQRRIAPVPEMAQLISQPDAKGFVHAVESTTPIVPQQPDVFYHGITVAEQRAALAPNVTDIGHETGNKGVFSAGPNDTQPVGFKITIPTDPPITLVKHAWGPFGYIYEQVG